MKTAPTSNHIYLTKSDILLNGHCELSRSTSTRELCLTVCVISASSIAIP